MRRSRKPVWAFRSIGGSNPPLSAVVMSRDWGSRDRTGAARANDLSRWPDRHPETVLPAVGGRHPSPRSRTPPAAVRPLRRGATIPAAPQAPPHTRAPWPTWPPERARLPAAPRRRVVFRWRREVRRGRRIGRRGTYPPRSVQGPDRRWHLLRRRLGRGNAPAPTTQPCPSVMPEHPTPGLPPCPVADEGGASTRTTCSPVRRPHASATGSVRKSPRNHATPLVCPRVAMREG